MSYGKDTAVTLDLPPPDLSQLVVGFGVRGHFLNLHHKLVNRSLHFAQRSNV
jgi:hypothetical protein